MTCASIGRSDPVTSDINNLLTENYLALDPDEKRIPYKELARPMEQRANEADATDLSRLAWLYLRTREVERALETAEKGLDSRVPSSRLLPDGP